MQGLVWSYGTGNVFDIPVTENRPIAAAKKLSHCAMATESDTALHPSFQGKIDAIFIYAGPKQLVDGATVKRWGTTNSGAGMARFQLHTLEQGRKQADIACRFGLAGICQEIDSQ